MKPVRKGRAIIRNYIIRDDISKLIICVPAKICVSICVQERFVFSVSLPRLPALEPLDSDFRLFAALAGVACEKRESNYSVGTVGRFGGFTAI